MFRVNKVSKAKKKAISAFKKTVIISKIAPDGTQISTMSRTALFDMGEKGLVYLDELINALSPDYSYLPISESEVSKLHRVLRNLNPEDKKKLNDYYVFATFMPPGENKIITTFGRGKSKQTVNLK